jgi:hypothetical protein
MRAVHATGAGSGVTEKLPCRQEMLPSSPHVFRVGGDLAGCASTARLSFTLQSNAGDVPKDRAQEDPMTGPTKTTKPASQDPAATAQPDHTPAIERSAEARGGEMEELARTQEDVAERARRLVAGELITAPSNGHADEHRVERLREWARADLLAELRGQEQEQARRQLAAAARSGEDAVVGVVQGITTIVRSIVPAALTRPEEVIEATFALADQGLRVGRRLALTVTSSVRSLTAAA